MWAAQLIVKDGYILTNNTLAFKKHSNFDVKSFIIKKKFQMIQLNKYDNRNWAKLLKKK
jgi:hypothetical protein